MDWVRSSKCDTSSCVEVAWRRSTKCDTGTCVEVAEADDLIHVRNSEWPDQGVVFTRPEWDAFIWGAKEGEFDL